MFHVKDAEFNPTGRQGVYSGYAPWVERAGRFRSPGDGQVDFGAVFSKLTAYDFDGWAVVEWECALKHPEDGAREGAEFVKAHIIRVTEKAFDDFAAGGTDEAANRRSSGWLTRGAIRAARNHRSEGGTNMSDAKPARIRLGMVGGGKDAFIGAVHRIAARIDDEYELVAGALLVDAGEGAGLGPGARAGARTAPTTTSRRWPSARRGGRTASRRWRSSRRTTCTRRWRASS